MPFYFYTSFVIILVIVLSRRKAKKKQLSAIAIEHPQILLLQVGNETDGLLEADRTIYAGYYSAITVKTVNNIPELRNFITGHSFHLAHLFLDIDEQGNAFDASGNRMALNELLPLIHSRGAHYILLAKNNAAAGYSGPSATGIKMPFNLVITLDRKGDSFTEFFRNIFGRVSQGTTLPMAWHQLAPQIPGTEHENSPECFADMGAGHVILPADK